MSFSDQTIEFGTSNSSYNLDRLDEQQVLSDRDREIFVKTLVYLMLPLNVIGIFTNLINIRVFLEQGVRKDSTNIGFLSISIFDFLSCVTMLPDSICYTVTNEEQDVPQRTTCSTISTLFIYAHIIAQKSGAWTTVYISLVRSLCVFIPLKVKLLFTPKASLITVVGIFIFSFVNHSLYAMSTKLKWMKHPKYNESMLRLVATEFSKQYLYFNSIFTVQFITVLCIITVTITTTLMVYKLIQVKKWRQKNTGASQTDSGRDAKMSDKPIDMSKKDVEATDRTKNDMSSKDVEMMKAVTIITAIYLVCVLMTYIPIVAMTTIPGVSQGGVNQNLFTVVYNVRFFFDSINSSVNFFFYIRVSTRYKAAFSAVFSRFSTTARNQEKIID